MPDPLIERLPHGPGFRFVDRILTVEPGASACGELKLPGGHAVFDGHLPDDPIVPGVIIIEALAQVAGIALMPAEGVAGKASGTLAGVDRIRFRRRVGPDETLRLSATLVMRLGTAARFRVSASVGGETAAEGELTIGGLAP